VIMLAKTHETVIERSPTTSVHLDLAIADRVRRALDATNADRFAHVRVTVVRSWITLKGNVPDLEDKQTAERLARETSAARGVTNDLSVCMICDIESIRTAIVAALVRGAVCEAQDIDIAVLGEIVTIKGVVQNWRDYAGVEAAVREAVGVMQVKNLLVVNLRKHSAPTVTKAASIPTDQSFTNPVS
jgi:osmotically-inducible protein OsmY